jgi:hypothetical protein
MEFASTVLVREVSCHKLVCSLVFRPLLELVIMRTVVEGRVILTPLKYLTLAPRIIGRSEHRRGLTLCVRVMRVIGIIIL